MIFSYLLNMQSHPSWVCGLKLDFCRIIAKIYMSHPSWVCGLKLPTCNCCLYRQSHTLRGCVDWNIYGVGTNQLIHVTPFVGVWIETWWYVLHHAWTDSHTLRGCVDWNFDIPLLAEQSIVTPFVGVWIETSLLFCDCSWRPVTPFVGVWIET